MNYAAQDDDDAKPVHKQAAEDAEAWLSSSFEAASVAQIEAKMRGLKA